jgi:predicted nucleic-acid-binding protein
MRNSQGKTFIVDTNVILRFLVGDQPDQLKQAQAWFKLARQGEWQLQISSLVVAECCFVLESFYHIKREQIAQKMSVLLGQRWLQVPERAAFANMWDKYLDGLHFVDSYLLAWAKVHQQQVLSFDEKLKKNEK